MMTGLLASIMAGIAGAQAAGNPSITSPALLSAPFAGDYYGAEPREIIEAGKVGVLACIDATGQLVKSEVRETSGFERLDQAALEIARQSRFQPGTTDGVARSSCFLLPVSFNPEQAPGSFTMPKVKSRPDFRDFYPSSSIMRREQGKAQVNICVGTRGTVTSAALLQSSGHKALDTAAVRLAKQYRFTPGTSDGVAREFCFPMPVEFSVHD